MLGLPTSPRTWCSLITAVGQHGRKQSEANVPPRAWVGLLFGYVWELVSGGASVSHPFPVSPDLMPVPLASSQALLHPAAFVFPDSSHQGGSLSFLFGHLIPGQLADAVPYLISLLACIYAVSGFSSS